MTQHVIGQTLKLIDPSRRVAGPALTVDCLPQDNLAIRHALSKAQPGDVVVGDRDGLVVLRGAWRP